MRSCYRALTSINSLNHVVKVAWSSPHCCSPDRAGQGVFGSTPRRFRSTSPLICTYMRCPRSNSFSGPGGRLRRRATRNLCYHGRAERRLPSSCGKIERKTTPKNRSNLAGSHRLENPMRPISGPVWRASCGVVRADGVARELRIFIFGSGIEAVRAVFFDENREKIRFPRFPVMGAWRVRVCGCVRAWGCVGVCARA